MLSLLSRVICLFSAEGFNGWESFILAVARLFLLIEWGLKALRGMFSQTLMNAGLEGTAVPMTPFVLTWMVGMTVDVLMERTAQEIVSTKTKSSTMDRFGCWRMTGVLSVHARSVKEMNYSYSAAVISDRNEGCVFDGEENFRIPVKLLLPWIPFSIRVISQGR